MYGDTLTYGDTVRDMLTYGNTETYGDVLTYMNTLPYGATVTCGICYTLFIYLFIQHLLARPKTANKHERSGDSQPRQAKREKKERCCQRGKGDRERKRKGGTLIIHGITSDETVWKAGL